MRVVDGTWGWLLGHRPIGGRTGARLTRQLRCGPVRDQRKATQADPAELSVSAAVLIPALDADRKAEAQLAQLGNGLRAAAAGCTVAVATQLRHNAEAVQERRAEREVALTRQTHDGLAGPIENARPLVSPRLLGGAEIVIVLVEFLFWYLNLSQTIDRRDSMWSPHRLSAYAIAAFIPVVSLVATRFCGPALQRWLRYPADNTTERAERWFQHAAAIVALLCLGSIATATGGLVHWRYSSGSQSAFVKATLPPATWMTILFVGVIVVDASLRAFSYSEQDQANRAREQRVAADQAEQAAIEDAVIRAKLAWGTAHLALRMAVSRGLNTVEQLVATGERIILDARHYRAALELSAPTTLSTASTEANADRPTCESEVRWHVDIALLTTRLRLHADALLLLQEYPAPSVSPSAASLEAKEQTTAKAVAALDDRVRALLGRLGEPDADGEATPAPTEPPAPGGFDLRVAPMGEMPTEPHVNGRPYPASVG